MYRIGIDLGGTKVEGALLDEDGALLRRIRFPTPQEEGYDGILSRIQNLHDQLAAEIPNGADHTFGIGTPGGISARTGHLSLSNTLCLNGRPIRADLEARLGRPVALQNDANCFALAEAVLGAGRGYDTVFGVIMGTGCGGGIVHKGEVMIGRHFRGGEWGHMSIDPYGPLCYCGRRGCVESYISGGGLQRRYEEQFGARKTVPEIEAARQAGDAQAEAFFQEFLAHFGRAVANLITVLDPDILVLGGGVSNCAALYTEGVAHVARCILGDELTTPIVRHSLGDSAGVFGAALIGIGP
jgi:fructokinase